MGDLCGFSPAIWAMVFAAHIKENIEKGFQVKIESVIDARTARRQRRVSDGNGQFWNCKVSVNGQPMMNRGKRFSKNDRR